jgi:hypothetical protein
LLLSASLIWVTNASSPFLPSITGLPLTLFVSPPSMLSLRVLSQILTLVSMLKPAQFQSPPLA